MSTYNKGDKVTSTLRTGKHKLFSCGGGESPGQQSKGSTETGLIRITGLSPLSVAHVIWLLKILYFYIEPVYL